MLQRRRQQGQRFLSLQPRLRGGGAVFRVQPGVRGFAGAPPAMRADDTERDAEQPGAKRTGRVQVRPVAVEHHEDLLQEVLDVARTGAQPLQRPVHVVQLPIERLEAVALRRRRRARGTNQAQ